MRFLPLVLLALSACGAAGPPVPPDAPDEAAPFEEGPEFSISGNAEIGVASGL